MAEITHLSPEESRVVFVLGKAPLYHHSVKLCGLVKDDNTRTCLQYEREKEREGKDCSQLVVDRYVYFMADANIKKL